MGVLRWKLAFAVVTLIGVLALALSIVLGIYQGQQQRIESLQQQITAYQRELAAIHYRQGLALLQAGRLDEAEAELEAALELQPDYPDAAAALQRLRQTRSSSTPVPSETVASSPSLSVAEPGQGDALKPLFEEATQAYQLGNWTEAIQLLESLRLYDLAYQQQEVERMLFEAYRQRGAMLVEQNRFEEALRMFDRALMLKPDAQEVRNEREWAALYINGLSYWRADWQQAIARFQKIYERNPSYRDVRQRLADAHASYAKQLGERGNWCAAAEQYEASLKIVNSEVVRTSHDLASERCKAGVGVVAEVEGVRGGISGRVTVAARDPHLRRYRIFTIMPGQAPQVLVEEAIQPAWSPDGKAMAFRSLKADELGLELLVLTTGQRRRVTFFAEDGFPSWSPDGQQLVFASNREGDRRWRIYRVWAWAEGTLPETSLGLGRSPAWSPDGQRIAYQGCDEWGNRCGLWTMAPDGSNRQPLTNDPSDTAPSWSPDGKRLAFMSYERTGRWDIYILQVATGKVTPLVMGAGNAGLPVWSPDGQQIAFLSDRSGSWAIYVIPAAGGAIRKLADLPGTTDDWLSERLSWGR
ncbi:MAG: tetratricopeptide repeat protein [Anaerolineae bacterium]|nr:tetratricopeptide repeat protein [Anaerolineae bacterium]MDW8099670.1 tetratricopeptide repeat protein [Anaerolineae bacterium]